MNQPKVTVYITNFNYGIFIQKAVESVLQQSFQDFELFIIDDGSTDNSKEIIEQYRNHPKVHILYQQNKGLNKTNNVALNLSNGQYIVRLDADDFFEPDALEIMSKTLDADSELGLVFPDYYYVDRDGQRIGEERRHDFDKDVSVFDQPAHGACTMVRVDYLRDLGGYDEQFTCQDGYDLWIKMVTNHKVTNINQPLFSYRRHGNNLTENEARILNTRQQIKRVFIERKEKVPPTVLIIPVRHTLLGGEDWLLSEKHGDALLYLKIKTVLESKNPLKIVVTSASQAVKNFCLSHFENELKFAFVERPEELELGHVSLAESIKLVLNQLNLQQEITAVMTVSVEFPFLKSSSIDEAIDTLVIFKADSVVSVRPDSSMYYRHTGSGMQPILDQDKFTKLEREALYKSAGGIMLTKLSQLHQTGKSVSGNVAHIVVESKEAFAIQSKFEWGVFDLNRGNYVS
jgi:glycosyltransferase involved in cell wall biosynthesis